MIRRSIQNLIWAGVLVLAVAAAIGAQESATTKSNAKTIATGHVVKIDAKKSSFMIADRSQSDGTPAEVPSPTPVPRPSGYRSEIDNTSASGGAPLPSSASAPPSKNTPPGVPPNSPLASDTKSPPILTTIWITPDTTFKEGDKPIAFADLKIEDFVTVVGSFKGHDVLALEVTRKPK